MRHNIPTARYESFTQENLEAGYTFLETLKAPYVLKADGLAAGKGVLIINDLQEAKDELKQMLNGMFGNASKPWLSRNFYRASNVLSSFSPTAKITAYSPLPKITNE